MTDQTPIKRAAEAVYKTGPGYDLTGEKPWEELSTSSQDSAMRNARAAFNSIDTDQLARVIHAWDVEGGLCDGPFDDLTDTQKDVWHSAALAVKNWLTGDEDV